LICDARVLKALRPRLGRRPYARLLRAEALICRSGDRKAACDCAGAMMPRKDKPRGFLLEQQLR
jgi:hypothetical protein